MYMRSSCHVLRRLRTSDGSRMVRSPDLLPPPLNSFPYRHPQVSSSLALHTQSMTVIHPTLILPSLSSVYRFSGSVMAYRCVCAQDLIFRRSAHKSPSINVNYFLGGPRNSRGTSEAPLQSVIIANTALRACKSKSLGAIRVVCLSIPCSKG
jgi:hypothetical protein